jgi:hypothetical protein
LVTNWEIVLASVEVVMVIAKCVTRMNAADATCRSLLRFFEAHLPRKKIVFLLVFKKIG